VDLVLLDYVMPEIDGALIAQVMKEYEPSVPIIMVTGDELSQESLAAVNRYLRKAQDADDLLQAVQDLMPSAIRTRFPTRP
jgi:CheY-like chemotaxis protein